MPSVVVNMGVATRTLVTEKLNAKVKTEAIFVDNTLGAADAVMVFNDVFTPSITDAVPGPVLTTVPRLHVTVPAGICQSLEDKLKELEFIGQVNAVRGILDANCFVTFIYRLQ